MRLLHLTAGAGGMYCGSCLRDNALATERHDVSLLPIYTPTRTDEPNRSEHKVFFSGIGVYLQQHVPLLRRTPAVLDFLWDVPAVIKAATGRGVSVDPHALGELTVSTLRGEEGFQAKEVRKLVRHLEGLPPFDVVTIPNSLLIALAGPLRRALGRPIVCTLQGEDLFLENLGETHRRQSKELIRAHAADVDAFEATSDYYADFMAEYLEIDRDKVHTVPIGIHMEGHDDRPRPRGAAYTIGYFARIAPEKGLHLLADAYRILRLEMGLPPSRLRAAGYLAPEHRAYLAGIEERLKSWGLAGEFEYLGEVDRAGKIAFLRGIDVLSVPSPYAEPKGLYLLEAMANAVPWVQPAHGAFPEIHGKAGGGLLFTPHDPRDLADKLLTLSLDARGAAELGRLGASGVREHYSASRMAQSALELYETVAATAAPGAARLAAGA
jgi:glycosyltransferase involved in cell wall biosynthesis